MTMNYFLAFTALIVLPDTALVSASLFSFQNDNRCFYKTIWLWLQSKPLINDLQCAAMCIMSSKCGAFMIVKSNSTCELFSTILPQNYISLTYLAPGKCRIALMTNPPKDTYPKYSIFTASAIWAAPIGLYYSLGICIGGGGGGYSSYSGGGGSGHISYGIVSAKPGTSISVAVGSGGAANNKGGASSIGSGIIAPGGNSGYFNGGGSGGSGGGAGAGGYGLASAAGGAYGSSGYNSGSNIGGSGQGSSVWSSAFASLQANSLQITSGSGGFALGNTNLIIGPGGGGGGGIMISGYGPQGSNGLAPGGAAGIGGYGYGAGAGGGGYYNGTGYEGGTGARGVCIIAWI